MEHHPVLWLIASSIVSFNLGVLVSSIFVAASRRPPHPTSPRPAAGSADTLGDEVLLTARRDGPDCIPSGEGRLAGVR
jgi:hypothetical protein